MKKKYHVYGIGNALLDREATVQEEHLQSLQVEKGVMTLIDESNHHRLVNALSSFFCHSGCGGSAANTMIALSQLGGQGFYSCKVADDHAGRIFIDELISLGLDCNLSPTNLPAGITGQCLVLVTEDAQRTMNTYLGITESLDIDALNLEAIAASEYLYLEGYLVASPSALKAMCLAREHAKAVNTKVALTLSDPNMIHYFRNQLLSVINGQIDLMFCNEEEALLFAQTSDLESAIAVLQPMAKQLVVTCGSRGAILAIDGEMVAIPTSLTVAIDTVGAGDMFAGAYLYAVTQGYAPVIAVELANTTATAVVSQYGARLSNDKVLSIKNEFSKQHYNFAERLYQNALKQVLTESV